MARNSFLFGWHVPEPPAKGVALPRSATPFAGGSGTCHPDRLIWRRRRRWLRVKRSPISVWPQRVAPHCVLPRQRPLPRFLPRVIVVIEGSGVGVNSPWRGQERPITAKRSKISASRWSTKSPRGAAGVHLAGPADALGRQLRRRLQGPLPGHRQHLGAEVLHPRSARACKSGTARSRPTSTRCGCRLRSISNISNMASASAAKPIPC